MSTLVGPYAAAAHTYRESGWLGVLPLPTLAKSPPPDGFTGHDGPWPVDDAIEWWVANAGEGNVAIRVPSGVIGIDVDHYGDKRGASILAELEAQWGPLPATWVSTSRPFPSGIRMFRVPAGEQYQTVIPGGIEVVQHHHRYLVAWPSVHPDTGMQYQWITPEGDMGEGPPNIEDLPELPERWVEGLSRPWSTTGEKVDNGPTIEHRETEWSGPVLSALERVTFTTGGRHDSATAGAMALARLEQLHHPGATAALDELGRRFKAAVTAPGAGQRNERAAEWEWAGRGGILPSARERARTSPAVAEPYIDPSWVHEWVAASGGGIAQPGVDSTNAISEIPESWLPIDLRPVLEGDYTAPVPHLLATADGRSCFFYKGNVNGLHGDSGIGKTWITLAAIAQVVRGGRRAVLVDYEANGPELVARLRALAVQPDEIAEQIIYLNPRDPLSPPIVEHLLGLMADDIDLVVIDSLGEAFGVDGIDENHDAEVAPWLRMVTRPLAEAGPAVVVVDHATKANDSPLHPSGSKRKRAAITGASYLVEAVKAPTRDFAGELRITCAKDRHGHYRRSETVATVDVTPYPDGGVTVNLHRPTEPERVKTTPEGRLRALAAEVVEIVKELDHEPSTNVLKSLILTKASGETKKAAIELAVAEGALAVAEGPRQAQLYRWVRDFDSEAVTDSESVGTDPESARTDPK